MNRRRYLRLMVGGFAGMVGPGLLTDGSAPASARAALQGAREERYRLSTIAVARN